MRQLASPKPQEACVKVVIRTDASGQIGGGHMMRCLALAHGLRTRGAEVTFLMASQPDLWTDPVTRAGYALQLIPAAPPAHDPDGPPHRHWLSSPWARDAEITAALIREIGADWLIWDHYGLDARWVSAVRAQSPALQVMAIDDLDDRPLGSDLVLDQTRLDPNPRRFPALAAMSGPAFATLRPEFAALREDTLPSRDTRKKARRVLVTMGLADAVGLMPQIVSALASMQELKVDIVMGAGAQTLADIRALCAEHPRLRLHVDTPDMAHLMAAADLCIGAGGMTSWERCALGLGTLLVPVAANQMPTAHALDQAGAVQLLSLHDARDAATLRTAILRALTNAHALGQAAAALCDGQGTARVCDIVGAGLRAVSTRDAKLLFDWRNQPHIRAASLTTDPLDWQTHCDWIAGLSGRVNGVWWIYSEGGRPLGHVNARRGEDRLWRWGFYIGAPDAPKGVGRRMLASALAHLLRRPDCTGILADVRADNPRSIHLHRSLGFQQIEARDDGRVLVFCLRECDIAKVFQIRFPKDKPT